ncbi:MAG: HNH endonuclease signature motif containing protein [Tabrizicola sp.]
MTRNIDLAFAREAFTYDPETGIVYWNKDRPISHFPTHRGYRQWLGRNAGKPAGSPNSDGHLYVTVTHPDRKRQAIAVHHIAWMLANESDLPKGKHIDHLNRDPTDNRPENLRAVDPYLNARNMTLSRKPSTGFNGIYKVKDGYEVRLTVAVGRSPQIIGRCKSLEEAVALRVETGLRLGYTPGHLGVEETPLAA